MIKDTLYLKRTNRGKITVDSLDAKIEYLMEIANVSGVAEAVFNNNKPVFNKTYGLANVQKQIPFKRNQSCNVASFAKMVFAYIAMKYIQEKRIDLDKPLVQYLNKPLMWSPNLQESTLKPQPDCSIV